MLLSEVVSSSEKEGEFENPKNQSSNIAWKKWIKMVCIILQTWSALFVYIFIYCLLLKT